MMSAGAPYTESFFARHRSVSRRSAERILPFVFQLLRPESVVDIGCGVGTWTAVAKKLGASVLGIDGDYVGLSDLEIDPQEFAARDLTKPLDLGRKYHLAISLEVAEHLPERASDIFVGSLCQSADCILFSGAIPRQGGTYHVNEQWPIYWYEKFRKHGGVFVDNLRPRFWDDPEVAYWYAQNMFLVVPESHPLAANSAPPLSLVHPRAWMKVDRVEDQGLREHVYAIPKSFASAIRKRI